MKVRKAGRIVSVAVILAMGVNTDGRREIVGLDRGVLIGAPFYPLTGSKG